MAKSDYAEKLKDPRWQQKRLAILERDGHRCRWCGASDRPLHVHHLQYVPGQDPWDADDDMLRTLCDKCHETERFRNHTRHEYPEENY